MNETFSFETLTEESKTFAGCHFVLFSRVAQTFLKSCRSVLFVQSQISPEILQKKRGPKGPSFVYPN